tara:strand:+ start:380 stop:1090 length:711 start_codon:yes stop_codon:yes gene_type:complete
MKVDEVAQAVFDAIDEGVLHRLYQLASVEPDQVLADLRQSGHPVQSIEQLQTLPTEVLDRQADLYIRSAKRKAAFGGASMGMGGWLGLGPGLSQMLVVALRLSQRISLVYGFDYRDERGELELWKGLAAAVGASLRWEGTEAELWGRLPAAITGSGALSNPLITQALRSVVKGLALRSSGQLSRWLPLVGGGAGMVFNYLEVDRMGRRLKGDWRARHLIASFEKDSAIEVEILEMN